MEPEPESLDIIFLKIGFGKFHVILLILCGLMESVDSIEVMLLAFLGSALTCIWNITLFEISFLTTSLFIGIMMGSIVFGKLCDRYGRKPILVISEVFLIFVVLLSALSPSIGWLIFMRSLVGVYIGGITVSLFTLIAELFPINQRANSINIVMGCWSIGSYYVTTMSYFVIPTLGWRVLLILLSIPTVIVIPILYWIPESPRFLLLHNRKVDALKTLNEIAKMNKSEIISDIPDLKNTPSFISDLVHPNYISTTLIMFYVWFTIGLNYYGVILIISQINEVPRQCIHNMKISSIAPKNHNITIDNSCCAFLSWQTYRESYISITGELIALIITVVFLRFFNRKTCFLIFNFINTICFFLLTICMPSTIISSVFFILRGASYSLFNLCYIYTAEVFPTSVRSVGLGLSNIGCRLGSILSSFVVNMIMMNLSFIGGSMIFVSVNILSFILIIILPYETKHRQLFQTANENEKELLKLKTENQKLYKSNQ